MCLFSLPRFLLVLHYSQSVILPQSFYAFHDIDTFEEHADQLFWHTCICFFSCKLQNKVKKPDVTCTGQNNTLHAYRELQKQMMKIISLKSIYVWRFFLQSGERQKAIENTMCFLIFILVHSSENSARVSETLILWIWIEQLMMDLNG